MKPLPFVLGTDILHISRLDPISKSSKFVNIAKRILHPIEVPRHTPLLLNNVDRSLREWVTISFMRSDESQDEPSAKTKSEAWKAAVWLAGRWAAKEAAKKAWGAALIGWKDVRVEIDEAAPGTIGASKPVKIVCQPSPNPGIDFGESEHQQALRQEGRLSISHDGEYCVATVIAEPLSEELMSLFWNRATVMAARSEERAQRFQEESEKQDKILVRKINVDFERTSE